MITLRHEFDLETCSLSEEDIPSSWPTCCFVGAFRGKQIFEVGEVNFSSEQAILFFAKRLDYVLKELERNTGPYIVEDLDSTWAIYLSRKGDQVEIKLDPRIYAHKDSVEVSYGELRAAAEQYLERVFRDASEIFPPLGTNEFMVEWINS